MNGIIVLNKPANLSSNTAVNIVKKVVGAKKAGHLGTLDVLGDGVLPITLEKATRLFDFFLQKTKTYRAVFAFGFETETLDAEGKIINIKKAVVTKQKINEVLPKFLGKISQRPPTYSALKINGKNAYEIARKGGEVELKERHIEVFEFKLLEEISKEKTGFLKDRFMQFHSLEEAQNEIVKNALENNLFEFEITCSSGTYIRSLARDLAKALSTYGTMLCITRTRCGQFEINESFTIEEIKNGNYKIVNAFDAINLPVLNLSKDEGKDLLDGKLVAKLPILESEFKVVCDGKFYGIGNNKNNGIIKISTFLKEEN